MFDILQYTLIQNALLAGSIVAVIAAIMGYFLIVRGLTFAGHALPNIGFAGAAGAVLLGLDPVIGLFAFTIGAGIGIGLLGEEVNERDTSIGVIMTFALGLGLLFLSLYSGYAERVYSILFGQIIGISQQDVLIMALASLCTLLAILLLFRPLLFSSFDPEVAEARGLPVRLLSIGFLILLAITISLAVQVVGALLVFTLLVRTGGDGFAADQQSIQGHRAGHCAGCQLYHAGHLPGGGKWHLAGQLLYRDHLVWLLSPRAAPFAPVDGTTRPAACSSYPREPCRAGPEQRRYTRVRASQRLIALKGYCYAGFPSSLSLRLYTKRLPGWHPRRNRRGGHGLFRRAPLAGICQRGAL